MRNRRALLAGCVLLVAGAAHAQGGPSEQAMQWNNRGAALLRQGKPDQAVEEFRRALQIDPGYVAALINLARTYDLQGRTDDAIGEYRKVLEREPSNSLAQNNLGVLYGQKGLHDEAIREFEQVLQHDPTNASAMKNLETTKRNKGIVQERDAQVATAVKGFEARPDDARAAYAVARTHAVQGQKDQALEWLAKAVELGFDFELATVDPAMVGLKDDPRFTSIVGRRPAPRGQ